MCWQLEKAVHCEQLESWWTRTRVSEETEEIFWTFCDLGTIENFKALKKEVIREDNYLALNNIVP